MNRTFNFSVGEYYHIYNRGVDKRRIYLTDSDYQRFSKLLYIANSCNAFEISTLTREKFFSIDRGPRLVDVGAYCLMPNHFHLVLKELANGGISQFMKKLLTGYAMYFNARNERTGALFQGKFKAKHISSDEYLRHVPLYVHMNSIDLVAPRWKEKGNVELDKAERFMKEYRYSSFPDFAGIPREEAAILTRDCLPNYYESFSEHVEDLRDWLEISPEISHLIK